MKAEPTVVSPPARLPLFALLAATAVSHTGNVLTAIAVPWFVLQTTESAAKTGVTAAVTVIPTIVAGIFGGALVDRLGYKRMSVVSDLASGVSVALIPAIHFVSEIAFWQLLVLMFLSALLDVPGNSARHSMIPELAAHAGMPLERANSATASIGRASQLAGPVIAGFLIASVGAANVLWIDAATFAVSASVVAAAIPAAMLPRGTQTDQRYLTDLKEGMRFLAGNRLILSLLITAASLNFIFNPLAAVILPVYANEVYGSARNLGLLLAANAVGLLAGAVLFGAVGHRLPRRRVYVIAFVMAPVPLFVLALTPGMIMAVAALVVLGVLFGPTGPIFETILQERTPADIRGRVFGLTGASVWIVLPIGMLTAGLLVEEVGVQATLLIDAIAVTVVSTGVAASRWLPEMDRCRREALPIRRPDERDDRPSSGED